MMLLAALLATSDPLPFAPPLDRPLRYRQIEHRVARDGTDLAFTLIEEARYTRDADGYVLTIRALSAEAKASAASKAMFDAGMKPFLGLDVRVRLSPGGEPLSVIDADATWARVVASLRASAAADPTDRRAPMQRNAEAFAALPVSARETMMKDPATALTGLAIPDLPPGGSAPIDTPAQTPFGPSLASAGAIRRLPDAGGARHYRAESFTSATDAQRLAETMRASDPQAADALVGLRLHETIDTSLSASSGLLLSTTMRIVAIDPAAPGGERAVSLRVIDLVMP